MTESRPSAAGVAGAGAAAVSFVSVDSEHAGQRIDNFLLTRLKGVPKSRIYRIIRKGEVRVNKKRVRPEYKLQAEDSVRIPPLRVSERPAQPAVSTGLRQCLDEALLHEDADLLVLNKPSGLAVHAGTGNGLGLIEALRQVREEPRLELVHRIDKATSGCVVVARNRSALNFLSDCFQRRSVQKSYLLVVRGQWPERLTRVDAAIERQEERNGERRVRVDAQGKSAVTHFRVLERFPQHTLLEACPETGRTHQIRAHCRWAGFPISGDDKYQGDETHAADRRQGVKRLCLHAASLVLPRPSGEALEVTAPCQADWQKVVGALSAVDRSR